MGAWNSKCIFVLLTLGVMELADTHHVVVRPGRLVGLRKCGASLRSGGNDVEFVFRDDFINWKGPRCIAVASLEQGF